MDIDAIVVLTGVDFGRGRRVVVRRKNMEQKVRDTKRKPIEAFQ